MLVFALLAGCAGFDLSALQSSTALDEIDSADTGAALDDTGELATPLDIGEQPAVRFRSDEALTSVGKHLALLGDEDGDGHPEVGVGLEDEISAVAIRGGRLEEEEDLSELGPQDSLFVAERAWDGVAYSFESAGDVDGDGIVDLVIGATEGNELGAGTLYVVPGPYVGQGRVSLREVALRFEGDQVFERSAESVGVTAPRPGDLDGDGQDDLLWSSHRSAEDGEVSSGAVFVELGPVSVGGIAREAADVVIYGSERSTTGKQIRAPGDMTGDGLPDLLIGCPKRTTSDREDYSGAAYLALAAEGLHHLAGAHLRIDGARPLDDAGDAVAAADLDLDGRAEIIVGAPGFDLDERAEIGAAALFSLPQEGVLGFEQAELLWVGERAEGGFGKLTGDPSAALLLLAAPASGVVYGLAAYTDATAGAR